MIVILLPAYNEEESLPQLMPKIIDTMSKFGEDYKVVVCNDGSKDKTMEILYIPLPAKFFLHLIFCMLIRSHFFYFY